MTTSTRVTWTAKWREERAAELATAQGAAARTSPETVTARRTAQNAATIVPAFRAARANASAGA